MFRLLSFIPVMFIVFTVSSCSDGGVESGEIENSFKEPPAQEGGPETENNDDVARPACLQSLYFDQIQPIFFNRSCAKANQTQLDKVNLGNSKKDEFLVQCLQATGGSCWCDQLVRPNPNSFNTFECTYGAGQVHQLINPDESTWKNAFEAVKIVEEFESLNILTQIIYNWWRPEPYNKNVGGAATRHPFGTSIDVRFKSKSMQNKAFSKLCQMRAKGRLRAIGYYASTAIHLGIGDNKANTWGKSCP